MAKARTMISSRYKNINNSAVQVLIFSQEYRFGYFLKSLAEQVGSTTRLIVNIPLNTFLIEKFNPSIVIINAGNNIGKNLRFIKSIRSPKVCVVAEKPDNIVGFPERITYFWRPLLMTSFLKYIYKNLSSQNAKYKNNLVKPQEPFLIGSSDSIKSLRNHILSVSKTDFTVLITGETGTGKNVAALSLHNNSKRRYNQYLEVNCSNVPPTLLESELFGYKKGAFTGAWKDKPGKFALASGGTIFLDEVSEMKPEMQAKLLQVLQDGEFSPVGSVESISSDVRVIAATNAKIKKIITNRKFRKDLYYRLAVITLVLPPLKKRVEDISILAQFFLEKYSSVYNYKSTHLKDKTWELFEGYDWPGNVRELENMIKSMVALDNENMIIDELHNKVKIENSNKYTLLSRSLATPLEKREPLIQISKRVAFEVEEDAIRQALSVSNGNKKLAAHMLGISYKCLLNKVKLYNI